MQQALLKILEGTVANVPPQGGRKHPQQKYLEVNTRNILFICGGAFQGLEKIVERRVGKNMLGFAREDEFTSARVEREEFLSLVEPQDLMQFGLIPELIGRLPVVTWMHELDKDAMVRILTEPRNALTKQYQKLLDMEDVELVFEPDAIEAIADLAIKRKTGARGSAFHPREHHARHHVRDSFPGGRPAGYHHQGRGGQACRPRHRDG